MRGVDNSNGMHSGKPNAISFLSFVSKSMHSYTFQLLVLSLYGVAIHFLLQKASSHAALVVIIFLFIFAMGVYVNKCAVYTRFDTETNLWLTEGC